MNQKVKREPSVQEVMEKPLEENIEVKEEKKPFNPLSKGRVIARFILKRRGIVDDKKNPYYANRAPKSRDLFVLPMRGNGTYESVLTPEEEAFYEKALGLNPGDLNVNKTDNNYWDSNAKNSCASVTLNGKDDTYFDKSKPQDMIKLAILRAYPDVIASSPAEMEERPRETYRWVLIDESAQYSDGESMTEKLMECNKILTKHYQDKWVLKYIVDRVKKVPSSPRTTLSALQSTMGEIMTTKLKDTYKVMSDKQLLIKANMAKARAFSVINIRSGLMLYNNMPLAYPGFEATEQNAADFLSDVKNQELYLEILSKTPNDI